MTPSNNFAHNSDKFDLDAVEKNIPSELNRCQKRAYIAAARHKAVLIAGGAGSGKSYVVARIAELYEKYG
ncbi:MAG TPA: hypothetical protein PLI53_05785, partial [Geobacteraceae bacterium]|nr:hypothetical protein [Geobacteraceae bacterium]